MPRKVRSNDFETRTGRLRLPIRKKPYFIKLTRGVALGYRRHKTDGTWIVRVTTEGKDWVKAIARSDDFENAGDDVLTFDQAQDRARDVAKSGTTETTGADSSVEAALDRYKDDLKARGADARSVSRLRLHLPRNLMEKEVGGLTSQELRNWRNGLATEMAPASANRVATTLRAALNLAGDTNEQIANRQAGLEDRPRRDSRC
jgi:hypothetical protein